MTSPDDWIEWMCRKAEGADGRPVHQGQQAASGPGPGQQPFTTESVFSERQGNSERTRSAQAKADPGFGSRTSHPASRAARGRDESDPRKPTDPPWRGRTARRTSTPSAMRALRDARLRRGWTLTRAAEETGVSRPHLSLLERGLRRPSESVAEDIIAAYGMTDAEADSLAKVAVPWAGRDSPFRTGAEPGER